MVTIGVSVNEGRRDFDHMVHGTGGAKPQGDRDAGRQSPNDLPNAAQDATFLFGGGRLPLPRAPALSPGRTRAPSLFGRVRTSGGTSGSDGPGGPAVVDELPDDLLARGEHGP